MPKLFSIKIKEAHNVVELLRTLAGATPGIGPSVCMLCGIVSDILAKGLSVKVNGTPWQRVILKMDDMLDEAIIILYGLMPSRQYDVELGILPGEASVRGQITTGASST